MKVTRPSVIAESYLKTWSAKLHTKRQIFTCWFYSNLLFKTWLLWSNLSPWSWQTQVDVLGDSRRSGWSKVRFCGKNTADNSQLNCLNQVFFFYKGLIYSSILRCRPYSLHSVRSMFWDFVVVFCFFKEEKYLVHMVAFISNYFTNQCTYCRLNCSQQVGHTSKIRSM